MAAKHRRPSTILYTFGTDGYNANLNHIVKCEPGEAFCQETKANFLAGTSGNLESIASLSKKIGPGHFLP